MANAVHGQSLVRQPIPVALQWSALVAAILTAAACGSSATTEVTAPSTVPPRCQTNLSGTATSFGPSGGTGTLNVGVSRECAWTASSQQSWIEIMSPREGQGEAALSFRVASNADPVVRRGAINHFTWHASGPIALARNLVLVKRSPERLAADFDWLYGWGAEETPA